MSGLQGVASLRFALGRDPRGTESLPCLLVDDLDRAADHYRRVLGFSHVEMLGAAALARRREGAVLLQLAPPGAPRGSHRRIAATAWDAVIYVADIERVAADLRRNDAHVQVGIGITDLSDRTLEVRDDWGNVLAFAESERGPRSGLRAAVPARVRSGLRDIRLARIERPHLRRFQRFYEELPDRRDVFFMFFTGGLLHWVVNAERHIPAEANLVLLGSALPEEEARFVAENVRRPFHNIGLGVDDNTTWEFLFQTCRHNFGWVDIDCFVLEPGLFAEMAMIGPDVAVNAIWTYEAAPGTPIGCTHLLFVNAAVARELRGRGRYISPTNHDWTGSDIPLLHSRTYCRVPTARQRRLLLEVLPPDDRGRPTPPGEAPFFDTLVAYQVIAAASGYRTHPVRALAHRTQAELRVAERAWQQDMSDEVVHVGGVSYYWKFFHEPEFRQLYLAVEHTMLAGCASRLPPYYRHRQRRLRAELEYCGLSAADAEELVRDHLSSGRGLSAATVNRLLDPGTEGQ